VGPLEAHADTLPVNSAAPAPDVYGYVYDSKGNKVPNAYVTIYYRDGPAMWLKDNPVFSGSYEEQGYYGFYGVDVGNYTVKAEIVDRFGDLYNGTASAMKFDDRAVIADVTVPDYVYSPWISPTPTPQPAAAQAPATITAIPSVIPTAKDGFAGAINPLYALAVSPLVVVGALLFMRNKKAPAVKSGQNVDLSRSQTLLRDSCRGARSNVISGLSEYFLMNEGYSSELEELVLSKIKYHYNDIAVIHRVEKISKKYGIELTVVYRDMKRIKTMMERGKYP